MTHTFSLFFALMLGATLLRAQEQQPATAGPAAKSGDTVVTLKDGTEIIASGFRFADGVLLVTQIVSNGTPGEVGYQIANIERVNFPDPAQLAESATLLADSKATAALAKIEPVVTYYSPFRTVPGNWWLPAARIKLNALGILKREREVELLVSELFRLANRPEAAEAARAATAEVLLRRNQPDKAESICDEVIKTGTDNDALARVWLTKGHILLAKGDNDGAAMAYLHIPVFYPDNRLLMPPALFGCGQAFVELDERPRALDMFKHLVTDYPASVETVTGKTKMLEIQRSMSVVTH